MGLFISIIIIVLGVAVLIASKSNGYNDWWSCPHGYDDFGCQPECPLYEHCWGKREE